MPDCAIASGCPVPDGRLISRIADETADGPPAAFGPAPAPACRDLLELLAGVTGGRPGQGRDHPVAAVLALAAAAVVAGSRSFTAIAGWAADVPAGVMQELYQRCGATRPSAGPPPEATIWRWSPVRWAAGREVLRADDPRMAELVEAEPGLDPTVSSTAAERPAPGEPGGLLNEDDRPSKSRSKRFGEPLRSGPILSAICP